MDRILFLSVQPKYAELILVGQKTAELRKVRPSIEKGDIVILYVSSPVKKVKALATVEGITSAHPDQLWTQISDEVGVTDQEYLDYFRGKSIGYAIHLSKLRLLETPITLSKLREYWPGFHPPQVYQYIPKRDLVRLLEVSQKSSIRNYKRLLLPQIAGV
jgi:predicted transcriptional regulator